MNVIGIDQSIKSTGVYYDIGQEDGSFLIQGYNKLSHRMIVGDKIVAQLGEKLKDAKGGVLFVREGYSYGSRSQSLYEIGELVGCMSKSLLDFADTSGIKPFIFMQVPPTTLKLWAFGTGAKKKDTSYLLDVMEIFGRVFKKDDLADAYMLARFGEELVGSFNREITERMKIALCSAKLKKKLKLTTKKKILEMDKEEFFEKVFLVRVQELIIAQYGEVYDMWKA